MNNLSCRSLSCSFHSHSIHNSIQFFFSSTVGLWLLPSPQRCESNVLKLTGLSPSSPQQLSYGYQNWESGDIINLNQSSGHARTLGYQDGDFCQPQLWKHRFTLDTRGSRSPFPSPVKKRISRSSQRRNRIRKEAFFSRKKAFPSPSAPSLPFWTLLPLRPKDVDSSGILDEEAEHTETGINNKSKRVPVSVLAKFCFSY